MQSDKYDVHLLLHGNLGNDIGILYIVLLNSLVIMFVLSHSGNTVLHNQLINELTHLLLGASGIKNEILKINNSKSF